MAMPDEKEKKKLDGIRSVAFSLLHVTDEALAQIKSADMVRL